MTASVQTQPANTRPARSPLPALAGIGALVASGGAVAVFGDPMRGSGTAAEAATTLAGSSAQPAAVLVGVYALLGSAVAGSLAARLGRHRDTGATRLIPVLAAGHLLLMTLFLAAPAAAVTVGTLVLGGGVSPVGAESALVVMNTVHPVAGWVGAGFLIAVAIAARAVSKPLFVASTAFAVGLLVPPVAWLVTYLMGAWFAGVGVWLWRRG
ncbi:hypothetical protein [Geodermatophilus chilensis]|uniref:hypothetical protein n=1 Tax=Geodermatophilus chilensis TaxID=2035835 RepID=UPI000C25D7E2|nr:hypothetical protein [Geodermatophilus chilensis]